MTDEEHITVEELARRSAVSVDTIRYYTRRGVLPAPVREGRRAYYDDHHLSRLGEIRDLADRGFSLDQVRTLLADDDPDPLVAALAASGTPRLSRADLANRTGLDLSTIDVVVETGLLQPDERDGVERFPESAVGMLESARALIEAGVPLQDLFELALRHAGHIESTVDDAVEIFRRSVVEGAEGRDDAAALTRTLVPVATRLVAQHFARTLVTRALGALGSGDQSAQVHVTVEWSDGP